MNPWIKSPLWDSIWILNGLWLGVMLFLMNQLNFQYSTQNFLFITAGTLFSYSHLIAPVVAFFSLKNFQKQFQAEYVRFMVWPIFWILTLAGLMTTAWIKSEAKFSVTLLMVLAAIYTLWNNWHGATQHYGVLSIYRIKSNGSPDFEKIVDKYYCLLSLVVLAPMPFFKVYLNLWNYFGIFPIDISAVPDLLPFVLAVSIVSTIGLIALELKKESISIPRILYLILIFSQVYAATISYFAFIVLISLNHWLVELGLTSKIMAFSASQKKSGIGKFFGSLVLFIVIGVFLRNVLERNNPVYLQILNGNVPNAEFFNFELKSWIILYAALTIRILHMIFGRYIYGFRRAKTKFILNALITK